MFVMTLLFAVALAAAMQVTRPSDREIVITQVFDAHCQRLFDALTNPAQIPLWLHAPSAKMTLITCEVNLKVGGTYRYIYRRAIGATIEVRGIYQEVSPPHRLVQTETYDFTPLELLTTTELDQQGEKTMLKLTVTYPSTQARDADYEGVVSSSHEAWSRLQDYLQSTK